MKRLAYFFLLIVLFSACENPAYKELEGGIYADMKTDKGNVILKLYPKEAPLAVANFISLSEGTNPKVVDSLKGKRYYDGLTFHRVVKDFMVQGGDPTATGRGNPGYLFFDEFARDSVNNLIHKHDAPGVLSMANSGPSTNGSQFFITHKPTPWLDGKHTIFGKVVTGQEVVDSIAQEDRIKAIKIVRIGNEAKSFDAPAVFTEELSKAEEKEKQRQARLAEIEEARYKKFLADKEVFQKKMDVAKAKETDSGLRILSLKKGKGKKVDKSVPVSVNFTLYLADGKMIQSTEGATPLTFTMAKRPMLSGFTEAVLKMREGDKSRLFVPYYLAYGERGGGGIFPKKADLIFDVEILKVGK